MVSLVHSTIGSKEDAGNKGSIAVGQGNDWAELKAGADGTGLVADSTQGLGVKFAAIPLAIAAGYKVARGQATTASASDTIVSGLATIVAVVATFDDDLALDPALVSASRGDQAGSPAAGSFLLKTWKFTSSANPTPIAATTFSKKVNWIAIGT